MWAVVGRQKSDQPCCRQLLASALASLNTVGQEVLQDRESARARPGTNVGLTETKAQRSLSVPLFGKRHRPSTARLSLVTDTVMNLLLY